MLSYPSTYLQKTQNKIKVSPASQLGIQYSDFELRLGRDLKAFKSWKLQLKYWNSYAYNSHLEFLHRRAQQRTELRTQDWPLRRPIWTQITRNLRSLVITKSPIETPCYWTFLVQFSTAHHMWVENCVISCLDQTCSSRRWVSLRDRQTAAAVATDPSIHESISHDHVVFQSSPSASNLVKTADLASTSWCEVLGVWWACSSCFVWRKIFGVFSH